MAIKNAAAQKLTLTELRSKALEESAFDLAVDEILYEDPTQNCSKKRLLAHAEGAVG